jgi:hypothetical protein
MFIVSGAKSQIIPAVVCVIISLELCTASVGAHGISLDQYDAAWGCMPHVF